MFALVSDLRSIVEWWQAHPLQLAIPDSGEQDADAYAVGQFPRTVLSDSIEFDEGRHYNGVAIDPDSPEEDMLDGGSEVFDGHDTHRPRPSFRPMDADAIPSTEGLQHPELGVLDMPSSPEQQPLLTGQMAEQTFGDRLLVSGDRREDMQSEMFTPEQLEFAMTVLEELGLRQRVPEQLNEDEEWQRFISDLFLASGWRQLSLRYREQSGGGFSKSQLVGDVQALQQSMRQQQQQSPTGDDPRPAANFHQSGEEHTQHWLFELIQEHVLSSPSMEDHDFDTMEPSHASDVLAYDMGQRCVWQQGFYGSDPSVACVPFYDAPASARAHLKLAFMHAADRLCSPRSVRTNDSPDRSGPEGPSGEHHNWPLPLMQHNKQIERCRQLLITDPEQALTFAQRLMEEAQSVNDNQQMEVLQLVCGDACVALKQHRAAISHFARFSEAATHGAHSLPLDALLEYVCGMLVEGYPAAQVTQAAEDGSVFDAQNSEGWLLLVKVLAEMIDAESAIEQAAEEENRHMVNKLLMLLGSNVTNRRERDARMQRCLQEGGDSNAERDTSVRRPGASRRPRPDEGGAIDIQQLQLFWKELSPDKRPALCSVSAAEFEKSVVALSTSIGTSGDAGQEARGRVAGAGSDTDGAPGPVGNANVLLLMLHASLTETDASGYPQGFQLSDALCDVKFLAETAANDGELAQTALHAAGLVHALRKHCRSSLRDLFPRLSSAVCTGEAEILDPTISAKGLFAVVADTITLSASQAVVPIEREQLEASLESPATSSTALVTSGTDREAVDEGASLLERLLAVEAGFELDGAIKGRPKIDIGTQLGYQQILLLVRTTSMLREHAGQQLPHAHWALGELCRRLLRKEPMRAIMTAQRAILATLARLMLRSVRAAFGEEQQKLKREEAERAEQELLESLEAEDSKRDGNETKKKAKKKKRRTGAVDVGDDAGAGADGSALDAPTDGAFDDAAENALEGAICSSSTGGSCSSKLPETARVASVSTRMVLTDDNAPPGAYAGWDDAAAIVAAAQAAAESGRSAASAAGQAQLAPVVASAPAVPAGTASVTSTDGDEEDSAEREAREAAEALAVVEAEEAAEEAARLAELRKEQGSSVDTWEEVSSSRRRRKDRAPEPTGGAPAAEQAILGYAESISADAAARLERRRGRDGETAEAVAYVEADGALDGATATVTDAAAVEDGDRGDFGSKTRKKRSKEVKPRPPGNALDEPLIGAAEKEASLVDGLSGFTPSGGTGGVAAAVLSEGSSAAAPPSAEDILLPSLAMPSVVVDSEGAVGGGRERAGSGDCAKASAPGTEAPVSAPAGSRRNKRSKATEAGSVVGAAVSQTGSGAGVATSGGSASGQNGGCTGSGGGSSAGGARRKGKYAGAPASNSVDDGAAIGAPAAPGLENKTGQHSCFVNVVVQTLWNVSAFRDAFLTGQLHGDASEEDGSIYVAMKEVCSMMDDSANATAIADPHGKPRQVRKAVLAHCLRSPAALISIGPHIAPLHYLPLLSSPHFPSPHTFPLLRTHTCACACPLQYLRTRHITDIPSGSSLIVQSHFVLAPPPQATASGLKEALYRLDSNFELGEMHDATEAHEALLEALHRAVAPREAADERAGERVGVSSSAANGGDGGGGESRDGGGGSSHGVDSSGNGVKGNDAGGSSIEGSCGGGLGEEASTHAVVAAAAPGSSASFVKRIFAMRMRMDYAKPADPKEEQSKPLHFDQWTQYVVASELRDAVQKATNGGASPLVRVLRKEAGTEPVTEGGAVVLATRKLNMLEPPLVFTLGLSNDSARASKSQISESLEGIEETYAPTCTCPDPL